MNTDKENIRKVNEYTASILSYMDGLLANESDDETMSIGFNVLCNCLSGLVISAKSFGDRIHLANEANKYIHESIKVSQIQQVKPK
jgi:hypothetical protein